MKPVEGTSRAAATEARFADLPDIVLGPLVGRPDPDWYQAPPGKWCAAQIVEHLALALEWSSLGFAERRAREPMARRPRTLAERVGYWAVLGLGWMPPGLEAPKGSRPAERVERAATEARFRQGVARFEELARVLLPTRRLDLFVKHPRMGDLTLEEWMAFHVIHARHHAKQIRARLAL